MALDLNNWVSLTFAVQKIANKPSFLMTNVFANHKNLPTETMAWDVYQNSIQTSKFNSKYGEPTPVASDVRKTKTAVLPRIFEKKVFDVGDLTRYNDSLKLVPADEAEVATTADKYILAELKALKDRITTTIEWMCAQALSTGTLVCSGDNIENTYDYEYVSGEHIVSPTADWSTSNAKIKKDLYNWKDKIYRRTGLTPTICLLGQEAAVAFLDSAEIQKALDTINYKVGTLTLNESAKIGANYLGTFMGIDFYGYGWAVGGAESFNPKKAVMLAPAPDFALYYGAVPRYEDGGTKLYVGDMLVQSIPNRYKTAVEIVVDARPLPVIHNPDLVVVSQVIA